jgi:hypothetical protein
MDKTVSSRDLAQLLGVTSKTIAAWDDADVVVRIAHRSYALPGLDQRLCFPHAGARPSEARRTGGARRGNQVGAIAEAAKPTGLQANIDVSAGRYCDVAEFDRAITKLPDCFAQRGSGDPESVAKRLFQRH